jgi:hypothetical protein
VAPPGGYAENQASAAGPAGVYPHFRRIILLVSAMSNCDFLE